jgi:hypothetical protein
MKYQSMLNELLDSIRLSSDENIFISLTEIIVEWRTRTSHKMTRAERKSIEMCARSMNNIINTMKAEAVERIKAEKERDELVKSVISTKGFQK